MIDLTPKFNLLPMELEVVIPPSFQDTPSQIVGGWRADSSELNTKIGKITIGSGDNVFKADSQGIYLGNSVFANAPFKVDMAGSGIFSSLYTNAVNAITIDYGGDILLKHGGDINFTSVTAPTACTATLITVAGNVDIGTHTYKITFVNASGETELGVASNTVTTNATNKQVALSAIPVSISGSVTARKIYRTWAGGLLYYYLATINNNTATTYTDNLADSGVGDENDDNRENTASGGLFVNGTLILKSTPKNLIVGFNAGISNIRGINNIGLGNNVLYSNVGGYGNIAIGYDSLYTNTKGNENCGIGDRALRVNTTGSANTAIGYAPLLANTTGNFNVAIGGAPLIVNTTGSGNIAVGNTALWRNIGGNSNVAIGGSSLRENTSGNFNTAIGLATLFANQTGSSNVALGYNAGYNETGSNAFYVDNRWRANTAADKANALLYGIFAAAAADQKLTINGLLNLSVSKTPASATATGTTGDIAWDANYIYVCTATNAWKRVGIAAW